MNTSLDAEVRFLTRPEGRIAYTVEGDGPLIVAVPGMGDLRDTYRELLAPLVVAGFRVAIADLRGHGDSDTGFAVHGDEATADDMLALIDGLGGHAVLVGNSMAGSAAIVAASRRPDAVAGLVLLAPFVREPETSGFARAAGKVMLGAMLSRPWGPGLWAGYYRKTLNRGAQAAWLGEHVANIRRSLSRPQHLQQFRALTHQLDHRVVDGYLAGVSAPAVIFVGELDPDYRDPAGELAHMGDVLSAETVLVPDAGHYPQSQRPDIVVPHVLAFVDALRGVTGWAGSHA